MQATHDLTSANGPRLARSIVHDISETMQEDQDQQRDQFGSIPKTPAANSESVITKEEIDTALASLMGSP